MDAEMLVAVIIAVFGSGGFWALVQYIIETRNKKRNAETKALMALLHDRVYSLCREYLDRGSCTTDEYVNLLYLYDPYVKMGGNGTAKRLKEAVDKLEINDWRRENGDSSTEL